MRETKSTVAQSVIQFAKMSSWTFQSTRELDISANKQTGYVCSAHCFEYDRELSCWIGRHPTWVAYLPHPKWTESPLPSAPPVGAVHSVSPFKVAASTTWSSDREPLDGTHVDGPQTTTTRPQRRTCCPEFGFKPAACHRGGKT